MSIVCFFYLSGERSVGLGVSLVVLIAIVIGGAVPALPAGFGTFEAAAVFVLARNGFSYEKALATAMSLHICLILLCFFGAVIIILVERIAVFSMIKAWSIKTPKY